MPTKTYFLDEARTEPLTARWGWFYRNFTLSYRDQPLTPVEAGVSLAQGGYRYELPGGRRVSAQLKRNTGLQEVELLVDGQPVPGSNTHPLERIKQGWYALLLVAVLSVTFGTVALVLDSSGTLATLGIGWPTIAEGLLFLALGWWAFSRRSAVVFYVALGLLVLDWIVTLVSLAEAGARGGFGGIFIRFVICAFVYRAARAAQELQREQEAGGMGV